MTFWEQLQAYLKFSRANGLLWHGVQRPALKRWYEPKIEEKITARDAEGNPTKVVKYALFDDRAYRMDKEGWRRITPKAARPGFARRNAAR